MAIVLHKSFAVHPGEWLRAEIVEPQAQHRQRLALPAPQHQEVVKP